MVTLPRRHALLLFAAAAAAGCRRGERAAEVGRVRERRLAGLTLHTVELGARRAPVRYALHGGPGLDHTYLRPWLDGLARDAALVYVDLRGHGRSSPPPDGDGYTLAGAADDLAALAAARGDPPIDVIAHDFGAAVALALAARHPATVRRLVLVSPLRDAAQVRAVAERSRVALGDDGWRRVLALTTAQGTLRDPRSLPELFRRLGPMWWHRPPSDAVIDGMARRMVYRSESDAGFLQALRRWDGRMAAAEVRCPVRVVAGASDRTFLPAESRALADALPHGSFEQVGAAGHLPFIEQNAAFLRAVEGFLRG
jgi:proline iminopeptidase